jgi:hypothetical protein
MSAYMYDAYLPVLCLLAAFCPLYFMMSAYLYGLCQSVCIMSSYLYHDCSAKWRLSNLYDVCLPVLCLASFTYDIWLSVQNDVLLPVWCLPPSIMSGYFNWCLAPCEMSGYLNVSAQLYDVCLLVWNLPTCMMSATRTMSDYLYYCLVPW